MPTQIKKPPKTAKSKTLPKKTSTTAKSKSSPKKTAGSPKTLSKKLPKPPSRTKKSKTQPKKTAGSPHQSPSKHSISRAETPSIKLGDLHDELLGNILSRLDLKKSMKLKRINHSFAEKNLVIEPETLDLTRAKINKTLIDLLNQNSDKTKVKKLILDDITFEDDEGFNAFIEYFKHFENVEELQICRFWSEQYKYKKTNGYYNDFFIILIENIRFLKNLRELTIKSIDIEEETENNIEKSFSIVFIETLKLLVNLKHLILQYNLMSSDTIGKINFGVYKKFPNTTIEKSGNITKMENGH